MKKDNLGITLVSLVITIIVLLILASITVYSGINTIRSARLTKFTAELKMMQQKVNELYDSYTNNKSVTVNGTEYIGTNIQNIGQNPEGIFNTTRLEEVFSETGSGITDRTGYMYYDTELIHNLGLENMEYEFFVNVEKRSVVSIEGFNDNGNIYYTLDQVPNGVYNVEYNQTEGNLNFTVISEFKAGQRKIRITNIEYDKYIHKWQIRFRVKAREGEEENTWDTTEEFTGNEYTVDIPTENLLEDYEIQIVHGNEITSEIKVANAIKIGDYVNYTYDSKTAGYNLLSTQSGYTSNQTVNQKSGMKWRILNIHENGTVDLLGDIDSSDQTIYFQGALGYNNGVYLLNDICKELYSNNDLGITARSVDLEDIESQMNETGIATRDAYIYNGVQYGSTKTYIDSYANYPNLYAQEKGSGIDTETVKTSGIEVSDNGYTSPTTETSTKASSLTVTQTYYNFSNTPANYFKDYDGGNSTVRDIWFNTGTTYWLASRFVACDSTYAHFGLRFVTGEHLYGYGLFFSSATTYNPAYGLRPVVSLGSHIKIQVYEGGNGNTNMHEINKE